MFRNAFKPGDTVPEPALYWVHHYQHRLAHVSRVKLPVFPECAQCGSRVRFEVAIPDSVPEAMWLREDVDFKHAVTSEP